MAVRINIPPSTATMEGPGEKTKYREKFNPKNPARILMTIAMMITAILFFEIMIADTAGIMR